MCDLVWPSSWLLLFFSVTDKVYLQKTISHFVIHCGQMCKCNNINECNPLFTFTLLKVAVCITISYIVTSHTLNLYLSFLQYPPQAISLKIN